MDWSELYLSIGWALAAIASFNCMVMLILLRGLKKDVDATIARMRSLEEGFR